MNIRNATILLTTSLGLLWSASILAGKPPVNEPESASDTRTMTIEKASEAATEAAADAIESISKDAARDLDVRLIGLNLAAREGAAITIAAN